VMMQNYSYTFSIFPCVIARGRVNNVESNSIKTPNYDLSQKLYTRFRSKESGILASSIIESLYPIKN